MSLYDELPSGRCGDCGNPLSSKTARGFCSACAAQHEMARQLKLPLGDFINEINKPDPFHAGRVLGRHFLRTKAAAGILPPSEQDIMTFCGYGVFTASDVKFAISNAGGIYDETAIPALIKKDLIREVAIVCK